jgi:hypothetical protein
MNIDKLAQRVTNLEGGKEQANIAQTKEILNCLHKQLLMDTDGNFNLYDLLHALRASE